MSVVVGSVSKFAPAQRRNAETRVALEELWKRLPFSQTPEVRVIAEGTAKVVFFDYGAAQEFTEIGDAEFGRVFAQGVLTSNVRKWLPSAMRDNFSLNPIDNPESVCGVAILDGSIRILTSCSGSDHFLIAETEEEWLFSNHQGALGAAIDRKAKVRSTPLAWSLHKFHSFDYEHHLEGMLRTQPGSQWTLTRNGSFEQKMKLDWSELCEPIDPREVPRLLNEVIDDISEYILGTQMAKNLSLSGGKDSRAVLGLLGDDIEGRWVNFNTYGEVYAPDVMAASSVVNLMGLQRNHYISKPSLVSQPANLVSSIANDLFSDVALSSLADIRQVGVRRPMLLGGHEFGTKDGPNTLSLEQFIDREATFFERSSLLSEQGRSVLREQLFENLREQLSDVPTEKLEVAWKIRSRMPLLIGAVLTNLNVAATEVHPFLDYRFFRLVLGSDPRFTNSQSLHYLLNRRMSKPIENAAFADDEWPPQLWDLIEDMGVHRRGHPAGPYKFNRAFPSQSSFGRYNWRVDLFSRMRTGVTEYLRDGDFDSTLVDVDQMVQLVERDEKSWSFHELYQLGSVLKFCLTNLLGPKLLDSQNRDLVENAVAEFVGPRRKGSKMHNENVEFEATKEALDKAQFAIRDLTEQIHDLTNGKLPTASRSAILLSLKSGSIPISEVNSLVPTFLQYGGIEELPDSPDEIKRSFAVGQDGNVTFSGYIFRDPGARIVLGFETECEMEGSQGVNLSESGFWYLYPKEDQQTGYFEHVVNVPSLAGSEINCFIRKWYTSETVYLAIAK